MTKYQFQYTGIGLIIREIGKDGISRPKYYENDEDFNWCLGLITVEQMEAPYEQAKQRQRSRITR